MIKKKKTIIKNKTFGHFVALGFYVLILVGLYIAATHMNYIWKWNSVPQYFVYEKKVSINAPFDGTVHIKGDEIKIVSADGDKKEINTKGYKINVTNGEEVYQGDSLAYYKTLTSGPLLRGLYVTLEISFYAAVLAFTLGWILTFMRISGYPFLDDIATVYITIIRGTPLLVQIFIFYFIIATIFNLERFVAGAASLGLFYGAYIAEILRGAIQSVDKGQTEASKSLGMNYFQTMGHIVMPQALKRALPALVGEVIAMVKDSSLVSVISITDLTKVGREIVANTFSPFETWLVVAAMYFSITFTLAIIGHRYEKKLKAKGGF